MEAQFNSEGVPIRYVDSGLGEALVLVHGFSASAEMWTDLTPSLVDRFRLISLDCRGHGRSGKPKQPGAYGREMVDDVRRLLDTLEIGAAHLVGYSMGAEIVLKLAVTSPDRVLSVCMGGSGWSGPADYANYRGLAAALAADDLDGLLGDSATPAQNARVRALFDGQDLQVLAAVATAMNGIIDVSREDLLSLKRPVLGIAGADDPELGNLEKMAGTVADFTMTVLDGRDHMTALADPGFRAAITSFLDGVAGRTVG